VEGFELLIRKRGGTTADLQPEFTQVGGDRLICSTRPSPDGNRHNRFRRADDPRRQDCRQDCAKRPQAKRVAYRN
jgi:hypothetical protein